MLLRSKFVRWYRFLLQKDAIAIDDVTFARTSKMLFPGAEMGAAPQPARLAPDKHAELRRPSEMM
jgi:hypothetical protein